MDNYSTMNYGDQGGNRHVVGGEVKVLPAGKITANGVQAAAIADHVTPASATAADIATKQNQILAALRGVGIIAKSV